MRRCDKDEADAVVDNQPYRLDSLAALKRAQHLMGKSGVVFPNYQRTLWCLEAEHEEVKRQRREEKRTADRAVKTLIDARYNS